MKKHEHTDSNGFKRLVAMPDDSSDDLLEYGLEIGLDLQDVFPDVPIEFLKQLQNALFDRGFREGQDGYKPNALKEIRSVILQVTSYDAHKIVHYLKSMVK